MKNEKYYRKLFKKEHDSLIGKGDNIQNVMTEDRFVRVIKKLTLTDVSTRKTPPWVRPLTLMITISLTTMYVIYKMFYVW